MQIAIITCSLVMLVSCSAIQESSVVQVPPGMHAVSMMIEDDLSVVPGNRVNLMVTTDHAGTHVAIKDVEVMHIERITKTAYVATLLVSRHDGKRMTLKRNVGKFSLRRLD